MLQIFDFGRSDRDLHHRSKNYIIIPKNVGPRNKRSAFCIHHHKYYPSPKKSNVVVNQGNQTSSIGHQFKSLLRLNNI